MPAYPLPPINTRLGMHYFPDTLHYRESDLQMWLPNLRSLGASWLTLVTPNDRAIPEYFVEGLVQSGIEPVLHFQGTLSAPGNAEDVKLFLESYAKWGVHYVVFFDRPNRRSAWTTASWTQNDLVDRFLDRYLPFAEAALQLGLTPVFPPLQPGGDYWDTAFLRTALQSLLRRNQNRLLDQLVLSAYAWTGERSLNWGAGGPERWPGAHPYFTPPNEEDQCGFRIFDWYLAISRAVLKQSCPVILFGGGSALDQSAYPAPAVDPTIHSQTNLSIARLMAGEEVKETGTAEITLDAVPPAVLACNFWLLATDPQSPYLPQAWFQNDSQTLPVVDTFHQWVASWQLQSDDRKTLLGKAPLRTSRPLIAHYLLLPIYEWGVADWHLDIIRPFIKKHQPTIGFSLEEAALAARVTVVGGPQAFTDEDIEKLRSAGCLVERISGDGTSIASQLAER